MKQCPQCGTEYADEFLFCSNDGASLVPAEVEVATPEPSKGVTQSFTPSRSINNTVFALIGVVVFAVVVAITLKFAGFGASHEAMVAVPDLYNISESQAQDVTEAKGLSLDITRSANNEIQAGYVISQSPEAGANISAGSSIQVEISTGSNPEGVNEGNNGGGEPDTRNALLKFLDIARSRNLTGADLADKSPQELDIMRNAIYARHGRSFRRNDLQNYFNNQSWYHIDPNYRDSKLSALETRNAGFILRYQGKG